MRTLKSPSRMQGMTVAGWMVTIIVVVVFATMAVKIVPAFLDYNTIKTLITNVMSDGKIGLESPDEIRLDISKRFQINNINVISPKDIDITKENGELIMGVDYEVRTNFFKNVDFVISFKHEFRKNIR